MAERLVVIGGDAAGMSAASQARRRRDPRDLEIVAFERGLYTSYSACGIPYFLGGVVDDFNSLIVRAPDDFRKKSIDVRIEQEVTEIDLDKRAVKIRIGGDSESWEGFDQLMVATGAVPVRPDLPGADAEAIFGLQVLGDAETVASWIEKEEPHSAVVVGGGYIGLEMGEALVRRGISVALVETSAQPMSTLDPDMGSLVADAIRDMGIEVHTEERATGFETDNGRVSAVVTEERALPADIVILGLGVRPNTELAEAAGFPIGSAKGLRVDHRMATEVGGVWAAGDCVEKFHRVSRKSVAIPLGTHANKEGRVAGINIGGGHATFPGVVGTALSKICDVEVGRTGLSEVEAAEAGFDALGVTIDSRTRAGYYPEAAPIKIKLVVEKGSGRLLGAQIVGREGAAKRIDVLAAMLWNEMSVHEMSSVDLSYAPPFSPVWEPVLIAARKASQRVDETLPEVR